MFFFNNKTGYLYKIILLYFLFCFQNISLQATIESPIWTPDTELPKEINRIQDDIIFMSANDLSKVISKNKNGIVKWHDQNGNNLLHYAVISNKDAEVIKMLISSGIDVNSTNASKQSALHLALKHQAPLSVLKVLLKSKANPNIKDNDGNTPLYYSIAEPNLKTIQLLRRYKARSDILNNHDNCALLVAIADEKVSDDIIIELAKSARNIDFIDKKGYTPLIHAVRLDLVNRIESLIDGGANINAVGDGYMSALMHAASVSESQAMFEMLISKKANLNQRDNQKRRAIDYANRYTNKVALRILGRYNQREEFLDLDPPIYYVPIIVVKPTNKPTPRPTTKPATRPTTKPAPKPNHKEDDKDVVVPRRKPSIRPYQKKH